MSLKKEKFKVFDMTCTSCENRVEKSIKQLPGVSYAKASYSEQFVLVHYDTNFCDQLKIKSAIKNAGYSLNDSTNYKLVGILIIFASILLLGMNTSGFDMEASLNNASYVVLFFIGVLTSIHCVGMCGGIMLSQSLSQVNKSKFEAIKPSIFYNLGRVLSYTILGGLVGAMGSVFSLSLSAQGALQIFAAIFMIIMGLNMFGFSMFRRFHIKLSFSSCNLKSKPNSPFLVGLLNGFMPCGPLQTMQLYALGTGSFIKGALSMLIFSLGTVPLMLTFGAISGLFSKGYTKKLLKFSGILIIFLGLVMGNRGLALYGININPIAYISSITNNFSNDNATPPSNLESSKAVIDGNIQILNMSANRRGYTPNVLYVQKGIPVEWVINGEQITSCNNAIIAPSINLQQKLASGENIIKFTPTDEDINFSCWMGMIRGVIKVVDNLDEIDDNSSATNSIYGDDLSKVKTEILVNKSSINNNSQNISFTGTGYELQPLVYVAKTNLNAKINFDLTKFDATTNKIYIVNTDTNETVFSFAPNENVIEFNINSTVPTVYAIVTNDTVLGVIETVDDIDNINLDEFRKNYID